MSDPDVTTVVVNWNTVGLLDECLASILAATPPGVANDVVVVDNGSTDGSLEHLAAAWPHVRVLANPENVGFCRANNRAIRATRSPYLLLVNTDARLPVGGIDALLRYFEEDDRAAVVGPRLVYGDGAFQRWTAGRLPAAGSMAVYLFGLDRVGPRALRRRGLYLGADTRQPFRPAWVSSAVMAVRRAALDEIGLLDERIFVYMDDVDLCARAGAAGWHVWYAADVTATHFMGSSSRRATGRASPEALRALNRWYVRRHGRAAGLALRATELAGFTARAVLHGVAALGGRPGSRSQAAAHATHLRLALERIDA
ncbi:glycosyltransferase family 2 protein [Pengzhenrongella sicca]|uniref:Glycosyltransferase family 2 protein n=1 Tax=Pengzhenrongella sicca TaxID=2819238 RepID=A0A8A4ZBI8_9MICO|nr:glycosyltransferase family 2 protein [Pengzhenrongella sicca]QTE29272.1 glycosyltransferase family 2 protein [Pengzhenrongella sicca]